MDTGGKEEVNVYKMYISWRNAPLYYIFITCLQKWIHTLDKGQNKSKFVQFFLKFVDVLILWLVFLRHKTYHENWHNIHHKDQFINVVVYEKVFVILSIGNLRLPPTQGNIFNIGPIRKINGKYFRNIKFDWTQNVHK